MTEWTQRELISIWNEALDGVVTLVSDVDDSQWTAETPCPGWSVGDVVAHLVDVEGVLARELRPDHEPDWETLEHVNNDLSRFTEVGVDYRRGMPKDVVIDELRAVGAKRRAQLDDLDEGADVVGPLGNPTTMDRLMRIRTLDIWMHEQDIRIALGRAGGLGTRAAQVSLDQIVRALPIVWTRNCQAPAGSTVVITVEEPGLAAEFAAIAGDDGKGAAVEPMSEPTVHLTLAWPDLVALSAGRVNPHDADLRARVTIAGDERLAETMLQALTITP